MTDKETPHLKELNNFVVPLWAASWKQLGEQLNIKSYLLRNIEKDHPNNCEECCSKMLQEWLDSSSNTTWEELFNAIYELDNEATDGVSLKMQQHGQMDEESTDHSTALNERQLHARTITRLRGKYIMVIRRIKFIIEENNYKVDQLILDLSAADDENQTVFSTCEALSDITTTNHLFLWISKYCSMYDYELLLALVESTECAEAIQLLDNFSTELHSSILKDLDLLSEDGELRDIKSFMPGTHKLEIKYVGGKCSLKTIENVQRIIYECFHLKRGSIILQGAQEGCVALIYQISTTVKSHLLQYQITLQDVEKLADQKINCIKVDDVELKFPKQVPSKTADVSDVQKPSDFTNTLSKQLDKICTSLSPEDLEATLSILRKIFDSIIQHPNDDKLRHIKLAKSSFGCEVWRHPACEELMKMSGWVVEDDHVRLRDDSNVHIVSQLLESLGGQKNVSHFHRSSESSISKYLVDEYKSLFSAVVDGNISEIQNFLKPFSVSLAGTIYCENGSSTNLLMSAILTQNLDFAELLVKQHSIDPYVANDSGVRGAFAVFTIAPQTFTIDFLKCCGVDMSFKAANSGYSLLHNAVFTCCFHVVCFLVEDCGVNVNITDDHLDTPLHIAYMAGHTDIAEYLIQHGADVMAVNSRSNVPYDYIDGISQVIYLSKTLQIQRAIHQVPGCPEYMYYLEFRYMGIEAEEAVRLTSENFPSLTQDEPTQPHDHTSFTKELISETSTNDKSLGTPGKSKTNRRSSIYLLGESL